LVGVSHVSIPYSTQIVCKSRANTQIPSVGLSHFSSPYLAQISCMSNANP
jgi:hypothetical protein